jgi:hypothetical protein
MRIVLLLSGLLVACGGASETDLFSGPSQSGVDSGVEKDTSVPTTDSGGGKDSSSAPDSAIVDANQPDTFMPPTTKIQCGNTACNNPPDVCCRSGFNQQFTYNCVNDPNTQCAANGDITIECTSPSDCNQGEVCCIDLNQKSMAVGVACQPAQQCQGGFACDPKKPNICPNGQSCKLSQFTLPGYYICRN